MSRPMLIVLLLMALVIISRFEWRQQFARDMGTNSRDPQPVVKREEVVKQKIILIQEKSIHRLNEFIKNLKEQLKKCACFNVTSSNSTLISSPQNVTQQLENEQIVEDEFEQQEEVPED